MTELGEIPSEWAISKIGELTEIKTGGTPSTKCEKYWKDGDIPWMASGDVNKKIINEVDGRITKSGMENSAAKLLPKDTVMIALNGQGKTKGTVAYLNIELTCNQSLAGFLPSYNVFNSKYLYYNLQSRYFEIRGLAGDGARNGLNLGLLREILIPIPSIKEQEKIALILSTVDEQIDNVDALIEKNKELKKGLMQTLLTKGIGHTKFKKTEIGEIPEEWEVRILGDIVEFSQGIQVSLEEQYEEYKYGYERFLRIIDYTQKSKEYRYIKHPGERYLVKNNDVVMVRYGATAGFVGTGLEGAIANNIFKITPNREVLLKEFLYVYLNQDNIFKSLNMATGASAMPAINFGIVSKLNIILPSIYEQKKITSILFEVDKKLEEYENKKQKLEELKKGLMQQLLTGMIRVTV